MSFIIKQSIIGDNSHLGRAIFYIVNENKTLGLTFSNVGDAPDIVYQNMLTTKKLFSASGKREGYHYKISFSKDEKITPKEALEFVKDFAEEYLNGNFEYICAAHQDRDHTHMHLVFNSVGLDGKKFRSPKGEWEKIIKPLSNRIAKKYNTGTLKEKDANLDYSSYDKKTSSDNLTGFELVMRDMDECILMSKSYSDFKRNMVEAFGYEIREGVSQKYGLYLSMKPPSKAKALRSYRLVEKYHPEHIEKRILENLKDKQLLDTMSKSEKTGQLLDTMSKSGIVSKRYKRMDWFMTKRYPTFIPYKEMTIYQQEQVRKMLTAKRLYRRTGTSLQMHEQSMGAFKKLQKETQSFGICIKVNIRFRSSDKLLDMMSKSEKTTQLLDTMSKSEKTTQLLDTMSKSKKGKTTSGHDVQK